MQDSMTITRALARVRTLPSPAPGFGGEGHEAVFVLEARHFAEQDPFIMLADDRLELAPGAPVGGAHPHAGFEIATFIVEGSIDEGEEGVLETGDVQWTTAGRGIVHGENAVPRGRTRILQLWFALPERDRWVEPHFEVVKAADAPVHREPGVVARVYAGSSGGAHFERSGQTPLTMIDLTLDPGARHVQSLPSSYNGFVLPIEGTVRVAEQSLSVGQVGWLDRPSGSGESTLTLEAGAAGARVVLYAGEPTRESISTHGPFVGGSRADLVRMGRDYVEGRFVKMSELARADSSGPRE